MALYIATCGSFAVADPNPQRARQRAISELICSCGGGGAVLKGTWLWEQIQECEQSPPREASAEEAAVIIERNTSSWATAAISRD
jgi:hypothetical protein